MSFGKLSSFINIVSTKPTKDTEGFVTKGDTVLASVRAEKEVRHANEKWANLATFSTATVMFRFRKIPHLDIKTDMLISCGDERYNILSVEDVRNRGMYTEILALEVTPSG